MPVRHETLQKSLERISKNPEAYKEEFLRHYQHLGSLVRSFETEASQDGKAYCDLVKFVCTVAPSYKEAKDLPDTLIRLMSTHDQALQPSVRAATLAGIMSLRKRNAVPADKTLPLMFDLLKLKDKNLRRAAFTHIVADVWRTNKQTKNQKILSGLQNFFYGVLKKDDPSSALHAGVVLVDLYRRNVWTHQTMVNAIANCCFSRHTKVRTLALKFLLGEFASGATSKIAMEGGDDDDDGDIGAIKNHFSNSKKTRRRANQMERQVKKAHRKMAKEIDSHQHNPIEQLYDAQSFAERLYSHLVNTKDKYEYRLVVMRVLSKLVSVAGVVLLPFYSYLERYMEPHQKEVANVLSLAANAMHKLVPPDAAQPLLRTIANHFVNEKSGPDTITIGLNTIAEMCKRQPLLMTEELLTDLVAYKSFKRDKGVVMASRRILQLYRDLAPTMLSKKDRGKFHDPEAVLDSFGVGEDVPTGVAGIELLEQYEASKNGTLQQQEEEDDGEEFENDIENLGGVELNSNADEDEELDMEEFEEMEEDDEEDGSADEMEEVTLEDVQKKTQSNGAQENDAKSSAGGSTTASRVSLDALRILTEKDLAKIAELREKHEAEAGKNKGKRKRELKDSDDEDDKDELTADHLELGTNKKRRLNTEKKKQQTEEARAARKRSAKKQQKRGGTTNKEKMKKHKHMLLTRHSMDVRKKSKSSAGAKIRRSDKNKKKNIKFKIKRGG